MHNRGAGSYLIAVTDVSDFQTDEVAAAQLAVDSQVEERKLAQPTLHLKADAKCPDIFRLERRLLPTILPLFHGSR